MSYFVEHKTYPYYIGAVKTLTAVPHIHTHLEMVFLKKGEALTLCDQKENRLSAGDIFLAFPNQIHAYRTKGEIEGYVMIFSAELTPQLHKLLSGRLPSNPVIPAALLPEGVEEKLAYILEEKKSGDPYRKLAALGEFLAFLSLVLPHFDYEEDSGDYDSMQKILTYLAEHFSEEITLESISARLFLNKYYISRLFRKRMDMTFHDFLSFLRVNRACELLQNNGSITQAALDSGFSSVRTFNRVFRNVMGKTPAQYRKEHR